ncbi:hypothetical protein L207DRAFT_276482 [Hyaloscypha variabilis F]|jgi:hypothetical protein|uniref:Uncharacterized protein n=1 Tax=Hyaloscypha variabilis (strain UAMH 11265 / GT02V1 / F) TaxID=1149755 RepID=A0A2J6S0I9_HYAVF|nr:hypothetical protein L207DRAFT_276482 [Hyaloscypha variabilis F]
MHASMHRQTGESRPRLQRQHPFSLPSCVWDFELEALPASQDLIRYSQPKSPLTSTSRERLQLHRRWPTSRSVLLCSALLMLMLMLRLMLATAYFLRCLLSSRRGIGCTIRLGPILPLRACPARKKQVRHHFLSVKCDERPGRRWVAILPAYARKRQAELVEGGIAALAAENGFVGIRHQKEQG